MHRRMPLTDSFIPTQTTRKGELSLTYPIIRPRRLREQPTLRRLVRETHLQVDNLLFPCFVVEGRGIKKEIAAMPGNYHLSIDNLLGEVAEVAALGIPGILLFGLPSAKDSCGSQAYAQDGVVPAAVRAVKERFPELLVITDVCLCQYTDHGHCGVVDHGRVENDATLELIAQTALCHAQAGADLVAPSGMMDGEVLAIRNCLDQANLCHVGIMAYSAKYASSFYGPFREAANSAPQFGDRRSYQMDPANSREARKEVRLDLAEGADIIMVKPALAYLDIIHQVKQETTVPVAAYSVSGEFAMLKAAALQGWINERQAVWEIMTGIKRAGADIIISYYAKDVARWLREGISG